MPLTRRLILQKARHHPTPQKGAQALTDCRRTVSGTISLPSRGTFHHSLTVLVRYRSPGSIQPYQVVLADSQQILGVHCYSGTIPERSHIFVYRTLTVYGWLSHTIQLTCDFVTLRMRVSTLKNRPTTPHTQPLTSITRARFRLHPLSLATTHGITIVFSSYGY
jgi:hypothetical protein